MQSPVIVVVAAWNINDGKIDEQVSVLCVTLDKYEEEKVDKWLSVAPTLSEHL